MAKTIYLLGAKDPEMDYIEKFLKARKKLFQHAAIGGKRVHHGNAYASDPVGVLASGDMLVCIECKPKAVPDGVTVVSIDHHNSSDFGFSKKPHQYWQASSVGQLYTLLEVAPDKKARVLAAMDHCFAAACQGRCPGVTPKEVMQLKIREISASTKAPVSAVQKRIAYFVDLITKAPSVKVDVTSVADLREHFLGAGYSLELLAAQVAAAKLGQAVLLRSSDRAGGTEKITLSGYVDPALVKAFISNWAHKAGLGNIYGSPERGYAGGYIL